MRSGLSPARMAAGSASGSRGVTAGWPRSSCSGSAPASDPSPPPGAAMYLILLAILVGFALPVQAGINAQLRVTLGHPIPTAFASFLVGTLALGVIALATRAPVPSLRLAAEAPAWHWTGGLLGAIYIAAAVVLAPRLGAATM